MNPHTRACIAYVAGRLVSNKSASSVFCYTKSKHMMIDGTVKTNNIDVFDYDRGNHFGGSGNSGKFDLFDYGESYHVELKVSGNKFEGFDYASSNHFSGDVSGGNISLYDYGSGNYHEYGI